MHHAVYLRIQTTEDVDSAHLKGLEVSPPGSPPSRAQQREVAIRKEKKGSSSQPLAPEQLDLLAEGNDIFVEEHGCVEVTVRTIHGYSQKTFGRTVFSCPRI